MSKIDELHRKWEKNPKYKRAYEKMEGEFAGSPLSALDRVFSPPKNGEMVNSGQLRSSIT